MSKKEYQALEVVQILAKALSEKLDIATKTKEYSPAEVTQELVKMIKEKLETVEELSKGGEGSGVKDHHTAAAIHHLALYGAHQAGFATSNRKLPHPAGGKHMQAAKDHLETLGISHDDFKKEHSNAIDQKRKSYTKTDSIPNKFIAHDHDVLLKPIKKSEVYNLDITNHLDAIEHHAFHAAARFHEDNEEIASKHLLLAKAHATVANVDPQELIDIAYSALEDGDSATQVFGKDMVIHPADMELTKALKEVQTLKTTVQRDVCESKYIPSGESVDSIHVGETPDDRKSKKLREEDQKMSKEEEEMEKGGEGSGVKDHQPLGHKNGQPVFAHKLKEAMSAHNSSKEHPTANENYNQSNKLGDSLHRGIVSSIARSQHGTGGAGKKITQQHLEEHLPGHIGAHFKKEELDKLDEKDIDLDGKGSKANG